MTPAGRLTSHRRAPSPAITYVLQAPNGITLKPGGPHVLGVTQDTYLSDLWQRVKPFLQQGKTIRCFWAACTAIDGASNPVVVCK
jgi:hypothetical protein